MFLVHRRVVAFFLPAFVLCGLFVSTLAADDLKGGTAIIELIQT